MPQNNGKTYIDYKGRQYDLKYRIQRTMEGVTHELILDGKIFSGKSLPDVIKKLQTEIDKENEKKRI